MKRDTGLIGDNMQASHIQFSQCGLDFLSRGDVLSLHAQNTTANGTECQPYAVKSPCYLFPVSNPDPKTYLKQRLVELNGGKPISIDRDHKRLGVGRGTLQRIMEGEADIRLGSLRSIADGLGVSLAELVSPENADAWPFRKIAYERFMTLDADDRAACQHELLSAIEKLEARALDQKKTGS